MKQLFITLLMFLILCGCDSLTDNESKSEENTKSNELKESTGSNELSGKTFSNNDVKFSFENSTVKQSSNEASRSVNWTDIADFNYTFNSESEPKTLDFQLEQVWGTGIAANYEKQLETAKNGYKSVIDTVNKTLNDDKLYSAFSSYSDKVKNIVTAKANSYIAAQEEILSKYLDTKYNSLIKFTYNLTDTTLTLTEVFQNNLTDASSRFIYSCENYKITLNDYDHVIPFKVEIGDKIFVGVPSFADGKISVQIYPYSGDILKDEIAKIATDISTKITTECANAVTKNALEILTELSKGDTSSTLEKCIDKAVGKQTLEANYKLNTTSSPAELTFTFTNVPELFGDTLTKNSSVTLKYTPLLQATVNLEK